MPPAGRASGRRAGVFVTLSLAMLSAPAMAHPCGGSIAGAQRLAGERYVLAYAPRPAPWTTRKHIALDIQVCPHRGVPMPDELRVDAHMPEHGHGMNYRPSVAFQGSGRWRAEGLLLHMAGRWELSFELRSSGRVERLVQELNLP
jgi:hypothetical protein